MNHQPEPKTYLKTKPNQTRAKTSRSSEAMNHQIYQFIYTFLPLST